MQIKPLLHNNKKKGYVAHFKSRPLYTINKLNERSQRSLAIDKEAPLGKQSSCICTMEDTNQTNPIMFSYDTNRSHH